MMHFWDNNKYESDKAQVNDVAQRIKLFKWQWAGQATDGPHKSHHGIQ